MMATMELHIEISGARDDRSTRGSPKCHLSTTLGQTPLQGVQMVETEEIRFEIGDACCSIAGRGYDVRAELARRHTPPCLGRPAAGTHIERLGTGRAFVGSRGWQRWACYNEAAERSRDIVVATPCPLK